MVKGSKKKKISRNDPCPCGSGKKYKKCCHNKEKNNLIFIDNYAVDRKIEEASKLSLEYSEEALIDSIEKLEKVINQKGLTSIQRKNAQLNLALAYQRRGEHLVAIDVLETIKVEKLNKKNKTLMTMIKATAAKSYCELGYIEKSCSLFDEALNELDRLKTDLKNRAFISLEAGKAFRRNGDNDKARECWEYSLKYFEGNENEIEHYSGAKANLGFLLLDDLDESKQNEGVKILEDSINLKMRIGDLEGLANNYCNLGIFYWKKKRYQRAIAYMRKDLYLSRKIGNLRSVGSTLNNLSILYAEMNQLGQARKLLKEAQQLGENLGDERLKEISNHHIKIVNKLGKKAGQNKELIGPKASCACSSGKEYQECCGRADFEPIDIPFQFDGLSEEMKQINIDAKRIGVEPSRLDFIFRESGRSKHRLAWTRLAINDGWLEMKELSDMANHHFISAEILADEAKSDPDSITKPLSSVILCACALEAFINQVAFFLHEVKNFHEAKFHTIPNKLSGDVMEFQRQTELTLKWEILGKALCGKFWPPSNSLWTDFRNLIYIRNELVHFKVADYEQVVPPIKTPHEIIKKVPASVEIRDIPHSWPARLLTPSFAEWCVKTTKSMIAYFKQSYRKSRGFETDSKEN